VVELVWLIPALPLAGFVLLVCFGKRLGEPTAGWLATGMVVGAFVTACVAFVGLIGMDERAYSQELFTWIPAGSFEVGMGFYLDPLSMTMVLFITGIAALIHLYSIGYMHGDPRFSKFFLYLNLFVFSMLMLVLGDNLLVTFLGWEGVGACSYFLISFWFEKPSNASAGKKAFVTNRIGDWGFMMGMFLVFFTFGSLRYTDVLPSAGGLAETTATLIALMFFVGAIGKSAQIPLFVWLPDAMAGPTPVSALIHAATMVTAGVYLLCRMSPVLEVSADWVPQLIAWTGALTALLAATIAVAQNDIKRVLAYSTVSQLGFMFLAVGLGAYWVAVFHMITHAFFKACLFLGAGSVIHGMHHNQDMRVMGALRKLMPVTAVTFMISWLAIAGIPPLSGFFSKDEVVTYAFQESPILYVIAMVTALLTAYYMTRQVIMVFFGEAKWEAITRPAPAAVPAPTDPDESREASEAPPALTQVELVAAAGVPAAEFTELPADFHPHESPWTMTVPLVVLGALALVGGLLNIPIIKRFHFLEHWLEPVFPESSTHLELSNATIGMLLLASTVVAAIGIGGAVMVYLKHRVAPVEPEILANGWYIDSSISAFVGGPGTIAFDGVASFDRVVIDGAVNGVGAGTRSLGQSARHLQSGYVRRYASMVGIGSVVLVGFMLFRAVV